MGIVYFLANSYCSYERGSNENNNRFICRFIRKGTDIGKCSKTSTACRNNLQQRKDQTGRFQRSDEEVS